MNNLTIRASSLPGMWDCAARWYAQNVEGKRTPNYGPAHLGTSLHHATAQFDRATIEESPITVSDAADIFVDRIKNPAEEDPEICWDEKMPQKKAIDVGVVMMRDYCVEMAPQFTFTDVEIKCNPINVKMDNGVTITLTGQPDRVQSIPMNFGRDTPKQGIIDVKSGTRIVSAAGEVNLEKHIPQLGTYELIELLVNRQTGLELTAPAEVIALPTTGKHTKAYRGTVNRPSKVLIGDDKHPGLLNAAAAMAKAENFPGNPSSILCSAKYCPVWATCWWRGHDGE